MSGVIEHRTKIFRQAHTVYKLEVALADNSSVTALIEILKREDIIYNASDYGGFEKVGNLGHTLPTNHTQISTQPGDVILYGNNQIVLFMVRILGLTPGWEK